MLPAVRVHVLQPAGGARGVPTHRPEIRQREHNRLRHQPLLPQDVPELHETEVRAWYARRRRDRRRGRGAERVHISRRVRRGVPDAGYVLWR